MMEQEGAITSNYHSLDPKVSAAPSHPLKFGILSHGHSIPPKGSTYLKSYKGTVSDTTMIALIFA